MVQFIILSDTFEQFAAPLMRQLGWTACLSRSLDDFRRPTSKGEHNAILD
jgi:phosphoserine phosphatase